MWIYFLDSEHANSRLCCPILEIIDKDRSPSECKARWETVNNSCGMYIAVYKSRTNATMHPSYHGFYFSVMVSFISVSNEGHHNFFQSMYFIGTFIPHYIFFILFILCISISQCLSLSLSLFLHSSVFILLHILFPPHTVPTVCVLSLISFPISLKGHQQMTPWATVPFANKPFLPFPLSCFIV